MSVTEPEIIWLSQTRAYLFSSLSHILVRINYEMGAAGNVSDENGVAEAVKRAVKDMCSFSMPSIDRSVFPKSCNIYTAVI